MGAAVSGAGRRGLGGQTWTWDNAIASPAARKSRGCAEQKGVADTMIEARERPHALEKESVMALSLRRANRVFAKAFDAETCSVPQLRKAHPCERHAGAWVLDHGARPTPRGGGHPHLGACWG